MKFFLFRNPQILMFYPTETFIARVITDFTFIVSVLTRDTSLLNKIIHDLCYATKFLSSSTKFVLEVLNLSLKKLYIYMFSG